MSVLAGALADARQDGHPALLIGGEAGAGKSRLLAEFQATAPGRAGAGRRLPGHGRRRTALHPVRHVPARPGA